MSRIPTVAPDLPIKSRFRNSAGSALGRQTAVCGVLDFQHIPEYASDLRPCIDPFAKPMNPHRTFQTGCEARPRAADNFCISVLIVNAMEIRRRLPGA
jgi:hypothetical protein